MTTLIGITGLIIYHSHSNYYREIIMQFFIIMTSRMIFTIEITFSPMVGTDEYVSPLPCLK